MFSSLAIQDVTKDVVIQRASTVLSVLTDVEQVSATALSQCSTVLTSTIINHASLAASTSAVSLVAAALSSILDLGNAIPISIYQNVSTALDVLMKALVYSSSINEAQYTLTTNNFVLSTQVSYAGDSLSTPYAAPYTSQQTYTGSAPQGCTLNVSGNAFNSIGVGMLVYTIGVHSNRSSIKSSYKLSLVYFNGKSPSTYLSVFQNPTPVNYSVSYPAYNNTYNCIKRDHKGNAYTVVVPCVSGNVTVTCHGSKGNIQYTCPAHLITPSCTKYDPVSATFINAPNCKVISYNSYNTTCRCKSKIAVASGRRSLAAAASQQSSELGATVNVVISSFVSTWESAGSLTAASVTNNWVILTISSCISTLFIISFIGMLLKFKKTAKEIKQEKGRKKRSIRQFFDDVLPEEFRDKPWFVLYWDRMLAKHKYFSFLSPLYNTPHKRFLRGMIVIGRIVNMMFFATIISSLVLDNNGYCGGYITKDTCLQAQSLDLTSTLCTWDVDTYSCSFNQPSSTLLSGLILSFIVIILAVPLDIMVERMASYCIVDTRPKKRKMKIEDETLALAAISQQMSNASESVDALSTLMTKKSKYMLAARLVKMKTLMDDVGPKKEIMMMMQSFDNMVVSPDIPLLFETFELAKAFKKSPFAANFGKTIAADTNIDAVHVKDIHIDTKLLQAVRLARKRAVDFEEDLHQLESDEEREKFLLRRLIIGSLTGFRHAIAFRYFFDPTEILTDERQWLQKLISLFLLPTYLIGALFFIFLFGVSLGPSTTYVWLAGLALNLLQDIFIMQPLIIFINFTLLSNVVRDEVHALHGIIYKRTKIVMRRTKGLLINGSFLVHHINPACRVARKFPNLTVSRLLMMLNDYDFPSYKKPPGKKNPIFAAITGLILGIGVLVIVIFTFLPEPIQETLINLFVGGGISYALVSLAVMDTASIIVVVVIAAAIIALIVIYEWRLYQINQTKKRIDKYDDTDFNAIPGYNLHSKRGSKYGVSLKKSKIAVIAEPEPVQTSVPITAPVIARDPILSSKIEEQKVKDKGNGVLMDQLDDIVLSGDQENKWQVQPTSKSNEDNTNPKVSEGDSSAVNEDHSSVTIVEPSLSVVSSTSDSDPLVASILVDENGDEILMIGSYMEDIEGPGERARRIMEEERLHDMGRTHPPAEGEEKTVRELLAADPFHSNYTVEDMYQAMSREFDMDHNAFIAVRNSQLSSDNGKHRNQGKAATTTTSKSKHDEKHKHPPPHRRSEPSAPMWI